MKKVWWDAKIQNFHFHSNFFNRITKKKKTKKTTNFTLKITQHTDQKKKNSHLREGHRCHLLQLHLHDLPEACSSRFGSSST